MKCLAKWNPTLKDAFFPLLERVVTSDGETERKATVEMYLTLNSMLACFSATKLDFRGNGLLPGINNTTS